MIFENRAAAGRELGSRLLDHEGPFTLVTAIPRGGVEVAVPLAQILGAPLDICATLPFSLPGQHERSIGAVTSDGTIAFDGPLARRNGIDHTFLDRVSDRLFRTARLQEDLYREGRPREQVEGKTVILVDEAARTGWRCLAACRSLRRSLPEKLIVAVPIMTPTAHRRLMVESDLVVAIEKPEIFGKVNEFFREFNPLRDDDVVHLLDLIRLPLHPHFA